MQAVGQNGAILIEIIPNLELLIGRQTKVPQMGAQETSNRLMLTWQNFIRVFSREEHPLVCFIDDWQWADPASLELFKALMNDQELKNFFLLGAYRDNEVNVAHPFMIALNDLKNLHQINIHQIVLENLSRSDIESLLADTLSGDIKSLIDLIYEKTAGNPFFVVRLLSSLYESNDLRFDFSALRWYWDIEQIRKKEISDSVVDLLTKKIKELPQNTQNLLQLAACIGSSFEIHILQMLYECQAEEFLSIWNRC